MCCSAETASAVSAVAIDSLTPPSSLPSSTPPSSAPRILLVEDHLDSANLLCRLLVHRGFDVVVATTLSEARDALRTNPSFDLLLADLSLPDGSSLDLMRDLAARPRTLPAIALSGHGAPEDRRASLDAGFLEHLVKPVDVDVLWTVLDRAFASRAA